MAMMLARSDATVTVTTASNAFTSAGIGGTVRQNTRDDLGFSLDAGVGLSRQA